MDQTKSNAISTSSAALWAGRKSTLFLLAAIAATGSLSGCDRVGRAWNALTGSESRDPSTYGMPDGTPPMPQSAAPRAQQRADAAASGINPICMGKTLSPDRPVQVSSDDYNFDSRGWGPEVTRLVRNGSYTVVETTPMNGGRWCLVTLIVSGTVNGDSFYRTVQLGAF